MEISDLSLVPGSTLIARRGEPGGRAIMSQRLLSEAVSKISLVAKRPLIYLLSGVILAGPVFAQSNDETNGAVDTIVVTASRSPIAGADLGSATTIITRDQIELRQAR